MLALGIAIGLLAGAVLAALVALAFVIRTTKTTNKADLF
jgi:hypothetical protein